MTYYKVLWKTNKGLESISRGLCTLVYTPGQWKEPVLLGSKLFAFNNPQAALAYLNHPAIEIWECALINPVVPTFKDVPLLLDAETVYVWWTNGYKVLPGVVMSEVEVGTVIADAVLLTVLVHPARKTSI